MNKENCALKLVDEIIQMSRFVKIRPVTAEFFHVVERTDGRTDRYDQANIRLTILGTSLIMIIAAIYPVHVLQLKLVIHECNTKETEPHISID